MKWDHQLDLLGGFISKVLLSEPNKINFSWTFSTVPN